MANDKTYRAAVIGLGFIGAADQVSGDALGQSVKDLHGTHAQSLARHPRVQLVAGASRDPGRRERFEQRLGVGNTYAQWQDMLAKEQLDIVSVATNSPYHAEISIACAKAGVACVYCEKPLTTKLSDADELLRVCGAHNTLLVVNHNRRWEPLFLEARKLVADGTLGQIHNLMATWPAGRLGNVGTHIFDAMRLILDRDAFAVAARLNDTGRPDCRGSQYRDPGGWGMIEFEGGPKAFADAAEAISGPCPLELVIRGSLGKLQIRGFSEILTLWNGDEQPITVDESDLDSVDRAVQEIVDCLDNGRESSSSGQDGRAAMEIIVGFHVSHRRNGQWTELPLKGPDRDIEVAIG